MLICEVEIVDQVELEVVLLIELELVTGPVVGLDAGLLDEWLWDIEDTLLAGGAVEDWLLEV